MDCTISHAWPRVSVSSVTARAARRSTAARSSSNSSWPALATAQHLRHLRLHRRRLSPASLRPARRHAAARDPRRTPTHSSHFRWCAAPNSAQSLSSWRQSYGQPHSSACTGGVTRPPQAGRFLEHDHHRLALLHHPPHVRHVRQQLGLCPALYRLLCLGVQRASLLPPRPLRR